MKIKAILFGFLIVGSIIILDESSIQNNQEVPTDFKLGFKENEVLTYKISSFNEELALEYLRFPYITYFLGGYAYEGAYRFIRIDDIKYVDDLKSLNNSQNCSGWRVNISSWEWVTNYDWEFRQGDPDMVYNNLIIFRNPGDLGANFYNIEEMSYTQKYILDYLNFPYAFPINIETYLNQIDWAANWTVTGKQISIRYKESSGKFVKKIHTFNSDGFLKRTKVLTDDDRVIYAYVLEDKYVPTLILVYILILAGFIIAGIIYVILKIL